MREKVKDELEGIPFEPIGVRGFFEWILKDAESGKVVRRGVAKNVVVNSGKNIILQRLAIDTTPPAVGWMDMGTNNTAPADTQTDLIVRSGISKVAGTVFTSATNSAAGAIASMLWSASWPTGENNWNNQEVGLFNASAIAARTLLARATIACSKDSTQTLTINYTIQAQSS